MMASGGDEEADAILSDVESDEAAPVVLKDPEGVTELIAELERERKAREAAESSKSELLGQFNRLKALAHEAIKKRDESKRERDEALKELDEAVRSRDGLRVEIETSSHMLVSGIDKISGKVSSSNNLSLPKSHKYTGLPCIAYGVIKRTNEIVEELLKSRNDAREQMDHRNYEIAIEVSQLESAISNLRLEVANKASTIDDLERDVREKDKRIADTCHKLTLLEAEAMRLKLLVDSYDGKLKTMELKMVAHRPLLMDHLLLVSRIHHQLYHLLHIVDLNTSPSQQSDFSESFFMPQETDIDMEENIRASLAAMESISQLTKLLSAKTQSLLEEKTRQLKNLNETVGLLLKEKEHIATLLRSALSTRIIAEQPSQKTQIGLRDAAIDSEFSQIFRDANLQGSRNDNTDDHSGEENEIYSLASTLENIVKASQLEIVQLQHLLEESREEASSLQKQLDTQTKELNRRMRQIEELKEKERIANENVEGLMTDIAAAEEEIRRWKIAAEQEAAAGGAVEQDFTSQLYVLKEELEEAKQAIVESEKKLKFKEETAAAAMGARDAAERSLRLADNRATKLRDRIQELNRKVEELETHRDMNTLNRARYVCWPWQLLGIDFVGGGRVESGQQSSNEMELAEPLL